MPNPAAIEKELNDDTLFRSMRARMDLAQRTGEKLVEEYRERMAETLLAASLTLIPSEHLRDHEFCVSPGVYAAAKKKAGI